MASGHHAGAYYLAGYVVECALKACIAKQTARYEFPNKERVSQSWSHSLPGLVQIAGLQRSLTDESDADPQFGVYWGVVKDWKADARYTSRGQRGGRDSPGHFRHETRSTQMVKSSLVEADLLAGRRLVIDLDVPEPNRSLFRLKAAFWLYDPESQDWRLVLATPLVDEVGPLATYTHLQRSLYSIQPTDLSLQNISVWSPRKPLVKAIRRAARIPLGAEGVRLTRNTVGGIYIEDAYVYKLPPVLI